MRISSQADAISDSCQDGLPVVQHGAGGDAGQGQPFGAAGVVAGLIGMVVAGAVDLRRLAIEVQDEGADRVLAAKPDAAQPPPPQRAPQQDLRQGHATPQIPGAFDRLLRRVHRTMIA